LKLEDTIQGVTLLSEITVEEKQEIAELSPHRLLRFEEQLSNDALLKVLLRSTVVKISKDPMSNQEQRCSTSR